MQLKTLNEEKIKEWWERKKEERKGDDGDRDDKRRPRPYDKEDEGKDDERRPKPRPRPHPHFKHAIIGHVSVSGVSCEDQGPYLVRYGSKDVDKDFVSFIIPTIHNIIHRRSVEGSKYRESRHRRPRGAFFIFVKGCKRPEPRDD